jgi:Ca2+-binding RTX toxin-like protein
MRHFNILGGRCGRGRHPRSSRSRRKAFHLEALESRNLLTTLVLLDFDGATRDEFAAAKADLNYPRSYDLPEVSTQEFHESFVGEFASLNAEFDAYEFLDLDGNNVIDAADGELAVSRIVARVREDFAPYDVRVFREDMTAAALDTIGANAGHDTLVLVGGDHDDFGGQSASADVENAHEDFCGAGGSVGVARRIHGLGSSDAERLDMFVNALANLISHEVGHTFGLIDIDDSRNPEAAGRNLMDSPASVDQWVRNRNFWGEPLDIGGGMLSQHEYLTRWVHPSPNPWAAVLSPGELTVRGNVHAETASVSVLADGDWRVSLAGTFSYTTVGAYTVDPSAAPDLSSLNPFATAIGRISYEGHGGDDRLTVASSITAAVDADGGAGADILRGGAGDDDLDGQDGDDWLYGGAGDDELWGDSDPLEFSYFGHDRLFGGDGDDILYASDGTDFLYGEAGRDLLWGWESRSTLDGGPGDDTIYGGPGDETIRGGAGDDTLAGGAGDDTLVESGDVDFVLTDTRLAGLGIDTLTGIERARLSGGAGDNRIDASAFGGPVTLSGGSGRDILVGGSGDDELYGDAGNDSLIGNDGDDRLFGGGGDDALYGYAGDDALHGGGGDDALRGGRDNDKLYGEADNDLLHDEAGDDTLDGGAGAADQVLATADIDFVLTDTTLSGLGNNSVAGAELVRLDGGAGNNTIDASAFTYGRVVLVGNGGEDTLRGGSGADILYGGGEDDVLDGGAGDDRLQGGAGDDRLDGGRGVDQLHGEAGDDILRGGFDDLADLIWGGPGADTFVQELYLLSGSWRNRDAARDFDPAERDRYA